MRQHSLCRQKRLECPWFAIQVKLTLSGLGLGLMQASEWPARPGRSSRGREGVGKGIKGHEGGAGLRTLLEADRKVVEEFAKCGSHGGTVPRHVFENERLHIGVSRVVSQPIGATLVVNVGKCGFKVI